MTISRPPLRKSQTSLFFHPCFGRQEQPTRARSSETAVVNGRTAKDLLAILAKELKAAQAGPTTVRRPGALPAYTFVLDQARDQIPCADPVKVTSVETRTRSQMAKEHPVDDKP